VTDHLNGLRFDIYERVHLPDDVAAIEELEEIELVPHMQALPQEDQVLLRGHLLLSGIYRSQESTGVSQLEHWIPVEISLPLNRIQNVEELAVEIDNFDVDLLTTRSLNVTGVLALRGLEVQAAQIPIWRDDSFTVVHQAQPEQVDEPQSVPLSDEVREQYESLGLITDSNDNYDNNELLGSPADGALIEQEREDAWHVQTETDALSNDAYKESNWLSMFQNLEGSRKDEAASSPIIAESPPYESSVQWGDLSKERFVEPELIQQPDQALELEMNHDAGSQAKHQLNEEQPDVRVAMGGKPLEAIVMATHQSGVGLLSQLGEKGAKREAELRLLEAAQAEEAAQQANASAQSTGDELEWTRLFLNNGGQAQSFRKVKMCIVQREETLDLIANRYNVQPRELQLYNRLNEPYLSEGQVLYIP